MKGKLVSQILLKWKASLLWKIFLRESEDKLQNEIKHLENKYLKEKTCIQIYKELLTFKNKYTNNLFFFIWAKNLGSLFTKKYKHKK